MYLQIILETKDGYFLYSLQFLVVCDESGGIFLQGGGNLECIGEENRIFRSEVCRRFCERKGYGRQLEAGQCAQCVFVERYHSRVFFDEWLHEDFACGYNRCYQADFVLGEEIKNDRAERRELRVFFKLIDENT